MGWEVMANKVGCAKVGEDEDGGDDVGAVGVEQEAKDAPEHVEEREDEAGDGGEREERRVGTRPREHGRGAHALDEHGDDLDTRVDRRRARAARQAEQHHARELLLPREHVHAPLKPAVQTKGM